MQKPGICRRYYFAFFFCLLSLSSASAQAVTPELYNGLKWRLIGPFRGGRAVAATGISGNATTFYFGSVNGGIWQTTDCGLVWKPIFDGQQIASIGAIAVSPSDPKTIYVGTGESDIRSSLSSGDGIYKSVDGGQTWTNIGLRDSRQISRIVVDPQNAATAYVAALGHAYAGNDERGVYKTTDGGTHWKKILDQGPDVGAADLAMASGNPNILFATMWNARRPPWSVYAPLAGPGSGLYRSLDAGTTWSHLTGNGLPGGEWGRAGIAVSANGKRVYALIDVKKSDAAKEDMPKGGASRAAGLYRSDDGGDSWSLVNSDSRLTNRAWYFSSITIDPNNLDRIYMPNVALFHSEDGGKTISIVRGAPGGDDYHQLWIDPTDSTRMVLATDQGATISLDNGKTWSSWYNQPTAQLYHVITDNNFPYIVYGAQQDSGAIAIPSRTDHGQIDARDWFSPGGSESGYIAPDPNDPDIIYLSVSYGPVSRFDRRTSFSQDITPWPVSTWNTEIFERKYRDPWSPVLLFSPIDKRTLYLGTQFVMKTVDAGLHWETISPDLTGALDPPVKAEAPASVANTKQRGYGVVSTIAPSGLNGDLIWAGSDTGLIHLTRDGGKTWHDVTPKGLTDWSRISFIEASRFDPASAYVAVDRHRLDDQQPYLYRTRDYGASWQPINNGISAPSFVRVIRQDLCNRRLLFAGAELGIYVSYDDGDHWQSLQLNLPASSVQDLVIHGDDLVIGTHGRSFWILDDITALRQVSDATANQARLYSPATAVRIDNDAFLGTPLPPEEPAAENPPNGAIVDYYLNAAAAQIKLEIFDARGTLIRAFSASSSPNAKKEAPPRRGAIADRWVPKPQVLDLTPGMHRFVWDLAGTGTGDDSQEAGDDEEHATPLAPRVIPGNYELRLTVDGKTLSQPLKVLMDPRSTSTPADLEQQYELGRKIFAETMRARDALAEIRSAQRQLNDMASKLAPKPSDLATAVSRLQDSMKKILSGADGQGPGSIGLTAASANLAAALRVVETGHRATPSQAIALFDEASQAAKLRIEEWNRIKTTELPRVEADSH